MDRQKELRSAANINLYINLTVSSVPFLCLSQVNTASKQLEHSLNDFEQLFLNSRKFILGDNISFADLSAICEIDQPSEYRTKALQVEAELITIINFFLQSTLATARSRTATSWHAGTIWCRRNWATTTRRWTGSLRPSWSRPTTSSTSRARCRRTLWSSEPNTIQFVFIYTLLTMCNMIFNFLYTCFLLLSILL